MIEPLEEELTHDDPDQRFDDDPDNDLAEQSEGKFMIENIEDADHSMEDSDSEYFEPGQLYKRIWLDDIEEPEEYRPGGFHPVHIGDKFGTAGRYRVINKLGRGGLGTVWLCRDSVTNTYIALKIIIADESYESSSELRLLNREDLDLSEVGGEHIAVPIEHFWHDGPNGKHLCLVLPVLGPRVDALWKKLDNSVRVSRDVIKQITRGLQFLHKNGICHGDFRPSNILLRLKDFDELSEDELIEQLGEPYRAPLRTVSGEKPGPSGPEYLLQSLNLRQLDARFMADRISIIDFGESYDMKNPPEDLGITAAFRSPELLIDNTVGVGCDLWALACTIFEVRTRITLFENFMNDDDEIIEQMVVLLGKLPESWWTSWEKRGQSFDEGGTSLVDPTSGKPIMFVDTLEERLCGKGDQDRTWRSCLSLDEAKTFGNLLRGLLKYDPKERLSVEDVLRHEWFKI